MYNIKVIKSEQEHELAMSRLLDLMDVNPLEGTAESDELEVLALLVDQFETEQYPMDSPDPIDAIKFRMDQMELKNKDLVPYIGSSPKVSEVLNRKRSLSINMIRKLSLGLDIPVDVLIREPV